MKQTKRRPLPLLAVVVALLLVSAACGDSSDEPSADQPTDTSTDGGDTDTTLDAPQEDTGGSDDSAAPVDSAAALVPTATFPIDDGDAINSMALSPDGATIAVSMQSALGEPVTIRLHDAQTGEAGPETTFDAIGIGRLYWMGDDRIVAVSDVDLVWRSWDGATLEAFADQPFEFDCRATEVDRVAGYAYSIVEDDSAVCRTDPDTGEMVRSGDPVVDIQSLWARPGTSEVLVAHYPDPDSPVELLALDGADLSPGESLSLSFLDQVKAVGTTTWVDYDEPRQSLLEPGGLPAPDIRDPLRASNAGTYFVSSNGDNDHIFVSAVDGSVVGTMTAAWNLTQFSDWSIDDSVMVRLASDYQIERYEF